MAAQSEVGQISVANPNLDGTGTLVDVFTAGTNGSLIQRMEAKAITTTTAGIVRFFLYDGTNNRLYGELLVTAITPSATVAAFSGAITPSPAIGIKTGWKLKAATEKAETFNVLVIGVHL